MDRQFGTRQGQRYRPRRRWNGRVRVASPLGYQFGGAAYTATAEIQATRTARYGWSRRGACMREAARGEGSAVIRLPWRRCRAHDDSHLTWVSERCTWSFSASHPPPTPTLSSTGETIVIWHLHGQMGDWWTESQYQCTSHIGSSDIIDIWSGPPSGTALPTALCFIWREHKQDDQRLDDFPRQLLLVARCTDWRKTSSSRFKKKKQGSHEQLGEPQPFEIKYWWTWFHCPMEGTEYRCFNRKINITHAEDKGFKISWGQYASHWVWTEHQKIH